MNQPLLAYMLLAAVGASPATAQDGVWWCEVEGPERLNFDAGGIAFNEHTLCQTDSQIVLNTANDDTWSGAVACENIYVTGQDDDGTWLTHSMPVDGTNWLSLTGAADGTLYLRTAPDGPDSAYLPCS
jgi:hypothetical protein